MKRSKAALGEGHAPISAKNVFGRYNAQEEAYAKPQSVRADRELDMLIRVWKGYEGLFGDRTGHAVIDDNTDDIQRDYYQVARAVLEGRRFSAKTVERFSIAFSGLTNIEDASAYASGVFFSALVNMGTAASFRLHTRHCGAVLNSLFYRNCKDISIHGDVGEDAGTRMKSGRVVIDGDVHEPFCRDMEGGTAILNGNAHFDGNEDSLAGCGMKGGEIRLNGEVYSRSGEDWVKEIEARVIHGRIFHKGKLIVEK